MRLPPLIGSDDPKNYFAHDANFERRDPKKVIVPILTYLLPDPNYRFIGTGFFIAPGILVTARHVIEAFETHNNRHPCIFHFQDDSRVQIRRIYRACISESSDIGMIHAHPEGKEHNNPSAVLGAVKPKAGSLAFTYAFPKTLIEETNGTQRIVMEPEYYRGSVVELFPNGRDRHLLSWPCYQLDLHLHAAASGGPVFDDRGAVFAINCASMDPQTDISFSTSVDMILDADVGEVKMNGKHYREARIRDMIDGGIIRYD